MSEAHRDVEVVAADWLNPGDWAEIAKDGRAYRTRSLEPGKHCGTVIRSWPELGDVWHVRVRLFDG